LLSKQLVSEGCCGRDRDGVPRFGAACEDILTVASGDRSLLTADDRGSRLRRARCGPRCRMRCRRPGGSSDRGRRARPSRVRGRSKRDGHHDLLRCHQLRQRYVSISLEMGSGWLTPPAAFPGGTPRVSARPPLVILFKSTS